MPASKYDTKKAANKIKEWLQESRLKGYEIAKRARISAPYYCDISRGKQRGSIEVLARIAEVFGKTVNDLFEIPEENGKGNFDVKALRNAVTSVLGRKDSVDFIACFKLWEKSPDSFKKALQAFHR